MKLISFVLASLVLCSCALKPFTYDSSVADVQYSIDSVNKPDQVTSRALCTIVSAEACKTLFADAKFRGGWDRSLSRSDIVMLKSFTSIDVEDIETMTDKMASDEALQSLAISGSNLGRKLGKAVEEAKIQQVLEDFHDLFDRALRFDLLMLETSEGRIIVPPIVDRQDNASRVSEDGRQIRIVDILYTIRSNAKFALLPPNWRDYLVVPIEYPTEYDLVNAILPESKDELNFWRDKVIEGYLNGIDIAKVSYEARLSRLKSDYLGMQRYHLLQSYNMVSEPYVTSDLYVSTGDRDGLSMSLDDANLSIKVEPTLISQATLHRAIPRIRNFERFSLDDSLLPTMDFENE